MVVASDGALRTGRIERCTCDSLEFIGGELPANGRHHPPLLFHVIADVTPLARGSFGHRGTLKWQLWVDRWVEVTPHGAKTT